MGPAPVEPAKKRAGQRPDRETPAHKVAAIHRLADDEVAAKVATDVLRRPEVAARVIADDTARHAVNRAQTDRARQQAGAFRRESPAGQAVKKIERTQEWARAGACVRPRHPPVLLTGEPHGLDLPSPEDRPGLAGDRPRLGHPVRTAAGAPTPQDVPARHAVYYRMTARNRVWLAKRHLPAPLVPVYLGVWMTLTVARTRSVTGLRAWFAGFAEGVRTSGGPRRPMRWGTVWRLTRLGRPPIV